MIPRDCKHTPTLWVNFYRSGTGSAHIDREAADSFAKEHAADNPRIACKPIGAKIDQGISRAERSAHRRKVGPSRTGEACG